MHRLERRAIAWILVWIGLAASGPSCVAWEPASVRDFDSHPYGGEARVITTSGDALVLDRPSAREGNLEGDVTQRVRVPLAGIRRVERRPDRSRVGATIAGTVFGLMVLGVIVAGAVVSMSSARPATEPTSGGRSLLSFLTFSTL